MSADVTIKEMGISFSTYSEGKNLDRSWPFDIVPRIILRPEWEKVSKGLAQRTQALNHFINDVYNEQKILVEDVIPPELVLTSPKFKK